MMQQEQLVVISQVIQLTHLIEMEVIVVLGRVE